MKLDWRGLFGKDDLIRLDLKSASPDNFIPIQTQQAGAFGSSRLLLPNTKIDYARAVGDGLGSSVLMSPIKWIQRTFPEAPLEICKTVKDELEVIRDHALTALLKRPNPFYTGKDLWAGTLFSWIVSGDAYWLKIRGAMGKATAGIDWNQNVVGPVTALWYAPHWAIAPKWPNDGKTFISHYEYRVNGEAIEVHPDNVVHFRNGVDPRNTRHGLSCVDSELREIFIDDEASSMTATLMKNLGIPGMVISPEASPLGMPNPIDVDATKQYVKNKFTGDGRGDPLVMKGPTKVQIVSFNPAQLRMGDVRDVSEERVCAALGLPPAVVQFGTGVQQTKVGATMEALIKLAWQGCLIPMQGGFAEQIGLSLLPDFEGKSEQFKVRFNTNDVSALQENLKDVADACRIMVEGGWMEVAEARQKTKLDVRDTDHVYLRGVNTVEVPGDEGIRIVDVTPVPALPPAKQLRMIGLKAANEKQAELITRFERDAKKLEKAFTGELESFFAKFGNQVADATLDVLELQPKALKSAEEDLAASILAGIEFSALQKEFAEIGGVHYLRVAKATVHTIGTVMDLAVNLPNEREQEIIRAGGTRMGLIDLSEVTKRRLALELEAGRSAGEGPVELARRIRDGVPAGTWKTSAIRSRVIARTETLHAQRQSALETYKNADNVDEVMIFDGRLASSDAECVARDGSIVSFETAEAMMAEEHPSGTLAFAPVVGGA